MGKRISKTLVEIADSVKQNITNKLQHRKCVRRVKQINTYLEVQSKEISQKANLITILWIQLLTSCKLRLPKITQAGGTKRKND